MHESSYLTQPVLTAESLAKLVIAGPWKAVANSWQHTTVYDAKDMPICRLDLEDWGVNEDSQSELETAQTAVARMIAAAPEVLAASVEAAGCLSACVVMMRQLGKPGTANLAQQYHDTLVAAIEKATRKDSPAQTKSDPKSKELAVGDVGILGSGDRGREPTTWRCPDCCGLGCLTCNNTGALPVLEGGGREPTGALPDGGQTV